MPRTPERRAGANDLAGFIDAPEIKARKKISRPIILPMLVKYLCRHWRHQLAITHILNKGRSTSLYAYAALYY